MNHKVNKLTTDFKNFFRSLNYIEVPEVKITSGIDPSVRFIGSHISVLKPFLINQNIPDSGLFINQKCIRTWNLNKIFDDNYFPKWGSFFPSMGVLVNAYKLDVVNKHLFELFEDIFMIPRDDILVRISSTDNDLLSSIKSMHKNFQLELDSRDENYYRHKLGIDNVWGRNINVALRNSINKSEFNDIGNVIIIENKECILGVEVALGATTIIKELFNLEHVQDCLPVNGIETDNLILRRKLEDVIAVCTILFAEGLRPSDKHNRNRLLKTYIGGLIYLKNKIGMNNDTLLQIIQTYAKTQLNINHSIAEIILSSADQYTHSIKSKQTHTPIEQKIMQSYQ